ncbi:MAG TPA: DUF5063 domain-containing protein [Actinotalea sp.]|nr:DUF5063 domain-containing protein [Actinotalea sp.]
MPEDQPEPGDAGIVVADDLADLATTVADEAGTFVETLSEVAAGANPEAAIPLLLLAVSDVLAVGARLGAVVDIVPAERFEPDVGPEEDLDPLRASLENLLEGLDAYIEIADPVLGGEPVQSSLSGDLVLVAGSLVQGLQHYAAGQITEALWWWQYSYLANWGERGSSALRVLQTVLAHLRLDVDDEVAAEAEFHALHVQD